MSTVTTEVRFETPQTQEYMDDLINSIHKAAMGAGNKANGAALDNEEDLTPTAFDQVNGGIREWLNRRACRAPKVNVGEIIQLQRQVTAIKKEQLNDKMEIGTDNAYMMMAEYRQKLKGRAYRPQARINYTLQTDSAFDGMYRGKFGTAGLPSNQPDKINGFRDYSLDTNRGRLLPGITEEKISMYVDFY